MISISIFENLAIDDLDLDRKFSMWSIDQIDRSIADFFNYFFQLSLIQDTELRLLQRIILLLNITFQRIQQLSNRSQTSYYFDVFVGTVCQLRQHFPFNFRNNNISKFLSDNLVLFWVKISPAVLKSLSQAADDGSALLNSLWKVNFQVYYAYSMYIESKFEESATYMYSRLIFGNLSKDFKSSGPSFKYASTSSASALFLIVHNLTTKQRCQFANLPLFCRDRIQRSTIETPVDLDLDRVFFRRSMISISIAPKWSIDRNRSRSRIDRGNSGWWCPFFN